MNQTYKALRRYELVKKQNYYNCFDTGEYIATTGHFAHPYIRLHQRYGDNLEYTTDMLQIEFQRTLKVYEPNADETKVYAGSIDVRIEDMVRVAKLITKIEKTRERLHLYSNNIYQDYKTAIFALGLVEIKFTGNGKHIVLS